MSQFQINKKKYLGYILTYSHMMNQDVGRLHNSRGDVSNVLCIYTISQGATKWRT